MGLQSLSCPPQDWWCGSRELEELRYAALQCWNRLEPTGCFSGTFFWGYPSPLTYLAAVPHNHLGLVIPNLATIAHLSSPIVSSTTHWYHPYFLLSRIPLPDNSAKNETPQTWHVCSTMVFPCFMTDTVTMQSMVIFVRLNLVVLSPWCFFTSQYHACAGCCDAESKML